MKRKSLKRNRKFIQIIENPSFRNIRKEAKERGIGVQEMIRAVIIPEWLEHERKKS